MLCLGIVFFLSLGNKRGTGGESISFNKLIASLALYAARRPGRSTVGRTDAFYISISNQSAAGGGGSVSCSAYANLKLKMRRWLGGGGPPLEMEREATRYFPEIGPRWLLGTQTAHTQRALPARERRRQMLI
jgi:hypothetical protein